MNQFLELQKKSLMLVYLVLFLIIPIHMNAQINNDGVLILDSGTSIVLPHFDTTSIANSNIDAVVLSLYVLEKFPVESASLQITINPIDLNTNSVGDGLSTFIEVSKDSRINFRLPRELFEQAIHTQKRFLVHLVSDDQRIILKGSDSVGTTLDPRMTVEHSEINDSDTPDQPQIIVNNYLSIKNSQLHFGEGDNVGKNKIEENDSPSSSSKSSLLLKLAAIASIFGVVWGVYTHFNSRDIIPSQVHSGQGDNIGGDKIINKEISRDSSDE